MKVSELKEVAPLADVYELKPDARYIIFTSRDTSIAAMRALVATVPKSCVFACDEPRPTMFEIEEPPK